MTETGGDKALVTTTALMISRGSAITHSGCRLYDSVEMTSAKQVLLPKLLIPDGKRDLVFMLVGTNKIFQFEVSMTYPRLYRVADLFRRANLLGYSPCKIFLRAHEQTAFKRVHRRGNTAQSHLRVTKPKSGRIVRRIFTPEELRKRLEAATKIKSPALMPLVIQCFTGILP